MAEYRQGDRVVKMSGVCAGKYGTVNSVREDGTLNVTFDGERLPRFCDPERCGKVAANATKSRLKGFNVGDKVKDRHGNVGIVEKIQTDDAGPFGPPPSKYGDLLGIKIDGGRIGWLNETNAVLANSRVRNAVARNAEGIEKFEVGKIYRAPWDRNWLAKVLSRTDSSVKVAIKSARDKTWHGADEQVTLRINPRKSEEHGAEVAKGWDWEFWADVKA